MRLVPCEYFLEEGECLWRCLIDQMPAGEQRSASVEHACHRVGHFALLRRGLGCRHQQCGLVDRGERGGVGHHLEQDERRERAGALEDALRVLVNPAPSPSERRMSSVNEPARM
jgi:hypothetical protein